MMAKVKNALFSAVRKSGTWVYGHALRPGWRRWVLLVAVLAIAVFLASLAFEGVDYRKDPSALVPRSACMYVEAGNVAVFLKKAGDWGIWKDERRESKVEPWSQIQVDLAAMLGGRVGGLGTRLPLLWLTGAKRAAMAFVESQGEAVASWAIYMELTDSLGSLGELRIEPGLKLEMVYGERGNPVYQLSGNGDGRLYMAVVGPWLVVSSDMRLPEFAASDKRRPGLSLAGNGILPPMKSNTTLRGMFDPAYLSANHPGYASQFSFVEGWLSSDARVAFSARMTDVMTMSFSSKALSESVVGDGFWPLAKFLFALLMVLCIILALGIASIMAGWGGWFKYLAMRAGVAPAPAPKAVQPSPAFAEDTGLPAGNDARSAKMTDGGKPPIEDDSEILEVETAPENTIDAPNAKPE